MKLFCHLCHRLAFRDTCGKCRRTIDAHYEKQLRLMRGLLDVGAAEQTYYIELVLPKQPKHWRN